MTLVESLTKTNHLLFADMKDELQSMNNQLSTQSTENFKDQNGGSGTRFHGTKEEVVMQRTINNLKPNPELLEVWDPTMMVLQRSNWTNMRLILNKVAEDNYPDLIPKWMIIRNYLHKCMKCITRCFSEVMTTMFHQCAILMDCKHFWNAELCTIP